MFESFLSCIHLETITTLYFAGSLLCFGLHHSLPWLHQPTPLFLSLSGVFVHRQKTNKSFKLYLSEDIKAHSRLNKYQLYSLGNHLRGELRLLLRDGRAEGVALRDPVRLHRPDHERIKTLWVILIMNMSDFYVTTVVVQAAVWWCYTEMHNSVSNSFMWTPMTNLLSTVSPWCLM